METRIKALAKHLGCKKSEIVHLYDNTFEAQGAEYLVVTDNEADDLWEESLEGYIDDCILPEIIERYQGYFDDEAWKRDARMDGRGHSLSGYDGYENYETVNNETYYIYRTN